MTATVTASPDEAKAGVGLVTRKKTTIEVRTTTLELLVGGPYDDHPYGHTALRINVGLAERVYDYGRYGLHAGPIGQGVLRIWDSFIAYISEENSLGRITTGFCYEIPLEKGREINSSFATKISGKDIKDQLPHHTDYVIDRYHALGPNCTTVSVDAAKIALPAIDDDWRKYQKGKGLSNFDRALVDKEGWPKRTFMPADLKDLLMDAKPAYKKIYIYKK